MLDHQINNSGILRSLISLNNLVQEEIKEILSGFPINCLEYSILLYINQNIVTQYKISKEYNISVQRTNQLVNNLEKYKFVTKREIKTNGRIAKEMLITPKCKKIIKEINGEIVKKIEKKGMKTDLLRVFNENVKIFLDNLKKED